MSSFSLILGLINAQAVKNFILLLYVMHLVISCIQVSGIRRRISKDCNAVGSWGYDSLDLSAIGEVKFIDIAAETSDENWGLPLWIKGTRAHQPIGIRGPLWEAAWIFDSHMALLISYKTAVMRGQLWNCGKFSLRGEIESSGSNLGWAGGERPWDLSQQGAINSLPRRDWKVFPNKKL